MDPQIIPYGWGLFSEGEEVVKQQLLKILKEMGIRMIQALRFIFPILASNTTEDIYTFCHFQIVYFQAGLMVN